MRAAFLCGPFSVQVCCIQMVRLLAMQSRKHQHIIAASTPHITCPYQLTIANAQLEPNWFTLLRCETAVSHTAFVSIQRKLTLFGHFDPFGKKNSLGPVNTFYAQYATKYGLLYYAKWQNWSNYSLGRTYTKCCSQIECLVGLPDRNKMAVYVCIRLTWVA